MSRQPMIEIVVLTLFTEMFGGVLNESILRRAQDAGLVSVRLVNFRDYAADKHRTVDDYPFGGGAGMVLKPEPLFAAVEDVLRAPLPPVASEPRVSPSVEQPDPHLSRVVLMSPQGRPFTQRIAEEFSGLQRLVLVCGHYE